MAVLFLNDKSVDIGNKLMLKHSIRKQRNVYARAECAELF